MLEDEQSAPEAEPASVEVSTQETQNAAAQDVDYFAAAVEEARAEIASQREPDAVPADQSGDRESTDASGPDPQAAAEAQARQERASQAASLRERATLEAELRAKISADDQEEHDFRSLYTGLLAERSDDPEGFAERLSADPDGPAQLRFMQAYAKAHPEVTLDSPETPVGNRTTVYREAVTDAFTKVDTAIAAMAGKYGLAEGDLESAYQRSGNDFAAYLDHIVERAIANAVEKERPRIAKSERDAHRAELDVVKATRTITAPRIISGSAARASEQTEFASHEDRFKDAWQTAKRLAEAG